MPTQVTESNLREALSASFSSIDMKPILEDLMKKHRERHGAEASDPDSIGSVFFDELMPKIIMQATMKHEVLAAIKQCTDAGYKPEELRTVFVGAFAESEATRKMFRELVRNFLETDEDADKLMSEISDAIKGGLNEIAPPNN